MSDVLEVVTDFHSVGGPPLQEVQVVDFTDRRGHDYAVDVR